MIRKIKKLFYLSIGFFKDYSFLKNQQKNNFKKLNLDYDQAEKIVNNLEDNSINKDYNMSSEHLKLFAGLSLNRSFQKILEIGTYDGFNSLILSNFFPNAKIETLDLDDNDLSFANLYNRKNIEERKRLIKVRDTNISKSNNISFVKKNSIHLLYQTKQSYDLIWIDGFHGNPMVTMDILNAIRLINQDGLIMCDDVYFNGSSYDPYKSDAAIKTLEELKNNNIIEYDLFLKRIDKNSNLVPFEKKFIAVIKRTVN
jgi:predicted O-methyltransferase YrrM